VTIPLPFRGRGGVGVGYAKVSITIVVRSLIVSNPVTYGTRLVWQREAGGRFSEGYVFSIMLENSPLLPLPLWERVGVRGNAGLHPHLNPPPSRGRRAVGYFHRSCLHTEVPCFGTQA